ncbi:MAG: DoxX family membrane protein [Thermomicrobiales bacterium]|nr:DoxX family membrane protein [Thermomicrobiales bacterium]
MNAQNLNYKVVGVALASFVGGWLLTRGTDYELSASQQILALVGGLALFVAAVLFLYRDYEKPVNTAPDEIGEPGLARFLFSSTRSAPIWLGARLFLGWAWLDAGRHKLENDAWMKGGAALKGYWTGAVTVPEGGGSPRAPWAAYRELIQFMLDREWYTWFAKLIVFGEILIGLGLIVGALTGVAAFFGATLNMSFLLAGTVSTNPILLFTAIFMILGWRVAGWIGLDRFLLPKLGAPWTGGKFLGREDQERPGVHATTLKA